jgi:hypothetical protein
VVEDCVEEDPWEERMVAAWMVLELPAEGLLEREPMEETLAAEEDVGPLAVQLL